LGDKVRVNCRCCLFLFLGLAFLLASLIVACEPAPSSPENLALNALNAEKLLSHTGEVKIVEGIIVGGYYAENLKGRPTFLNFHEPHEGYFKTIIWGNDRDKFPPNPEIYFLGKKVRIKGLIETYKGSPQIVLHKPSQIWLVEYEDAVITRVIDGDTIEVEDGYRVRYIGIDTPERGEPYYWEALEANRSLVEGKKIRLERDVEDKDEYGRLLRYVWLDNTMVNAERINLGYAYSYSFHPNMRYQGYFLRLEKEARERGRGLWSD
jgi:micrococcal nuclease